MKSYAQLVIQVNNWNAKNPIGTAVYYYPTLKDKTPKQTKTRSKAWIISGHSTMIMIDGVSGGVSLDHIANCSNVEP
jgi:hypothetical protein